MLVNRASRCVGMSDSDPANWDTGYERSGGDEDADQIEEANFDL